MANTSFPIPKLLVIEQGVNWSNTISWANTPFANTDMTVYTANAGFQKFFYEGFFVQMSANLSNSSLVLSLQANTTAGLYAGKYVYQVNLTDTSNNVTRVQEGMLYLKPSIWAGNGFYETLGNVVAGDCSCNVTIIDGGTF